MKRRYRWVMLLLYASSPILVHRTELGRPDHQSIVGSWHEGLDGMADTARFFLATDFLRAREMLRNRQVEWVLGYDWERFADNSARLLGVSIPDQTLCRLLDRSPSQAPRFLVLSGQNRTAKLFRFADEL